MAYSFRDDFTGAGAFTSHVPNEGTATPVYFRHETTTPDEYDWYANQQNTADYFVLTGDGLRCNVLPVTDYWASYKKAVLMTTLTKPPVKDVVFKTTIELDASTDQLELCMAVRASLRPIIGVSPYRTRWLDGLALFVYSREDYWAFRLSDGSDYLADKNVPIVPGLRKYAVTFAVSGMKYAIWMDKNVIASGAITTTWTDLDIVGGVVLGANFSQCPTSYAGNAAYTQAAIRAVDVSYLRSDNAFWTELVGATEVDL